MATTLQDIKKMSEHELAKKLAELREEIRSIHFKAEGSKSKNVKEQKAFRKEIAQILTEINRAKGQVGKGNKKK